VLANKLFSSSLSSPLCLFFLVLFSYSGAARTAEGGFFQSKINLEVKNGFRRTFKGLDVKSTAKGIRTVLRASMSVLEGFLSGVWEQKLGVC
jgi:hypothetical protein